MLSRGSTSHLWQTPCRSTTTNRVANPPVVPACCFPWLAAYSCTSCTKPIASLANGRATGSLCAAVCVCARSGDLRPGNQTGAADQSAKPLLPQREHRASWSRQGWLTASLRADTHMVHQRSLNPSGTQDLRWTSASVSSSVSTKTHRAIGEPQVLPSMPTMPWGRYSIQSV